jgi:hypothetical protein
MGLALIKIHGALEDLVRIKVAEKAPHLRESVEDARQTNWKNLLDYGKDYLGFKERDCRVITEANVQRQNVAHGGNYEKDLDELKNYARFVTGWFEREDEAVVDDWENNQSVEPQRTYQPTYRPPPAVEREPISKPPNRRPWYRSTLFMIFCLLFLPPIWAILIITDRRNGCLIKLFAFALVSFQMLSYSLVLIPNLNTYIDMVQKFFTPLEITPTLESNTPAIETSTFVSVPPSPFRTVSPATTNASCVIIWVEYSVGDLGGKNRSMVWKEIVERQVRGSGMTDRQFYDSVVVQNPELEIDGYEFKNGKNYLLPECQQ